MKPAATPTNKRVLRRPAVLERTGLRETALDEAVGRGEFPPPFNITDYGRAVAWLEEEVDQWLASRLAKRDHEWKERLARREPVAKPGRPRKPQKVVAS
jgi:prophage regulatory protein